MIHYIQRYVNIPNTTGQLTIQTFLEDNSNSNGNDNTVIKKLCSCPCQGKWISDPTLVSNVDNNNNINNNIIPLHCTKCSMTCPIGYVPNNECTQCICKNQNGCITSTPINIIILL
eukprot:UN06109